MRAVFCRGVCKYSGAADSERSCFCCGNYKNMDDLCCYWQSVQFAVKEFLSVSACGGSSAFSILLRVLKWQVCIPSLFTGRNVCDFKMKGTAK